MKSWVWYFVAVAMRLLVFEVYNRCIFRAASVALPIHVAKYGPQVGLSELLIGIQNREAPLFVTWGCT